MINISSFILFSLLILVTVSCNSNKENSLDEEIQQRKNQIPQVNTQNQKQGKQQNLEVLTSFTPEQEKIKEEVLKVIYRNLEATQAEDIDGVLETIYEEDPQIHSPRKGMEFVFKNFDMNYELEDVQFLSISDEETRVFYKQTTRAVKGKGFNNTRTIGIHTLKKTKDGKWKIFKTENLSTETIQ